MEIERDNVVTEIDEGEMTLADFVEDDKKETEPLQADDDRAEDTEAVEDADDDAEGEEGEAEDDEGDDPDDDGGDDEPVYVKIVDDNGKEWEVPEGIAPGFMKEKDYRQKTQAVADMRREVEARQAEIEARAKRNEQDLKVEAELARLEAINAQYNQVDWTKLAQEDFYDAQQKQFERQIVRERLEEVKGVKNSREQQRLDEMQQETAKRIDEAESYGRENIPGWGAGKDGEILSFAREIGFDDETLRKNMNGTFMKMLHKAYIGETAMQRATQKPKPAEKKVRPATKVGAKSSGTNRVRLADADMASFIKARERGSGPSMNEL